MTEGAGEKIIRFRKLSNYAALSLLAVLTAAGLYSLHNVFAQFFNPFQSVNLAFPAIALGSFLVVFFLYSRLLHYREKITIESSKEPSFFLEKDVDEYASVKMLEKTGWKIKEKKQGQVELVPENPSLLSKWFGSRTVLKVELLEQDEETQKASLTQDGEEIEKDLTQYTPTDKGTKIENTGTTSRRVSLLQILLIKLQTPLLKQLHTETVEGQPEIKNRKLQTGLHKYELE